MISKRRGWIAERGKQRAALPLILLLLIASTPVVARSAPEPAANSDWTEWERGLATFYGDHPELASQRGSGWKPYNRAKWFVEQRQVGGEGIPTAARWQAFLGTQANTASEKSGGPSWFCFGPTNLAGRILDIEFDLTNPLILYSGSASGGLWKSSDGGAAWWPLTDGIASLAVGAIGTIPSDPNLVLIGTGEPATDRVGCAGLLRSTDGGSTWAVVVPPDSCGLGFHVIEVHPQSEVTLAGSGAGLWRSADLGLTWQRIGPSGNYTDVKWKPGSLDTLYVVRAGDPGPVNAISRSIDAGETLTPIGAGLPSAALWSKTKLAVTTADPNTVYAFLANQQTNGTLGLYASTDGGTNWMARNTTLSIHGGQGWYNASLVVDPNDANRVFAGGIYLWVSTDGGVNFNTTGNALPGSIVHPDHHAISYRPGSDADLLVATDGGIWESTDDGGNWVDRNKNLVTYQYYDICVSQADPAVIFGGAQDQGTDRFTGTTSWLEGLEGDGMVCNARAIGAATVFAEQQGGLHWRSNSGGIAWQPINTGITGVGAWVTPVDLDGVVGTTLYTSTSNGVFRTTDSGWLWTLVDTLQAVWISIDRANPDRVWTIGANAVRVTTDGGSTWSAAAPYAMTVGNPTKILAHPSDPNTAFATFSGYTTPTHVIRTTNLGSSWFDVTGNLPSQPVNAIAIDPGDESRWFIGTDLGVWMSSNAGTAWSPFGDGLPYVVVSDLEFQLGQRKLRAGTYGRGLWEVDLSDDPSTGIDRADLGAPGLLLDPPAPNPFRSGTVLTYAARNAGGEVRLRIFDTEGRLVGRLAEHAADGIIRRIRWAPGASPSGVYIAVLESGAARTARKLVVAR